MKKIPEEIMQFIIGRACFVRVYFGGHVTQEGIDLLIRTLELSKDCFPNAEESQSENFDPSRLPTEASRGVD
jgi:hypothetical protein